MKKSPLIGLLISIVGLIIFGASSHIVSAKNHQYQGSKYWYEQATASTPIPTALPVSEVSPTTEIRVLPPVGGNAGLVLGASVLVLIIVGGVLGARLREKHRQG